MAAFDSEFERDVLARSLTDAEYRTEARRSLQSHHFTVTEHSWTWGVILASPDGEAPNVRVFKAHASRDFPGDFNDEKREAHLRTVVELFRHKPSAPRAALKELTDFARFQALNAAMQESIKHLHYGRVDDAYMAMDKARATDVGRRPYDTIEWIEEWGKRMERRRHRREHPELHISIPTRIKTLDNAIIGIQQGELGLIVGTTGRGKSIMGTHLGFWGAMMGFPCVHIGLEMGAEQNATRFDSKFANFSYKRLKTYDMTQEELDELQARADRFKTRLAGALQIVSFPIHGCDIRMVRQIHSDRRALGRKTAFYIIDSGDHLNPIKRMDNFRLEQSAVYWDMAAFADECNVAVWSTTHAPKEAAEKIATAENVGESYDKARIADLVVTLNQSRDQKRLDEMDLYLAKYRDGESGLTIPLVTDFSRMHLAEKVPPQPSGGAL